VDKQTSGRIMNRIKSNVQKLQKQEKEIKKIEEDYHILLTKTAIYLHGLEIENKDEFIKENFKSHYDFFKRAVLED
jgi:hypothetical protein